MKKTLLIMTLLVSPALMSMQRAKAVWNYTADTKVAHAAVWTWDHTGDPVLQVIGSFVSDVKSKKRSLRTMSSRAAVVAGVLWTACVARDQVKAFNAKRAALKAENKD